MGNTDFFGHVASRSEHRGMFGVFYDMSPRNEDGRRPDYSASAEDGREQTYILVTTISGEALGDYERMTDAEVIELCVRTLRLMFPKEAVPHPNKYVMSRWGAEPYIRMSYSYVAVGSSGADYDTLAEDVAGKIFFAGEVREGWGLWAFFFRVGVELYKVCGSHIIYKIQWIFIQLFLLLKFLFLSNC